MSSPWIQFVKEFKTSHPDKSYKECLKCCSKLYSHNKQGKGFIKDMLRKRPKVITDLLAKRGDVPISAIQIFRTPVVGAVQKVINLMTSGDFFKTRDKLGYDDIFHLFMYVDFANGKPTVSIEKNQRVGVGKPAGRRDNSEYVSVNLTKPMTLRQMIEASEAVYKNLYYYTSSQHNCQRFIMELLNNVGLLSAENRKFIMQDAEQLVKSPTIRKIANIATGVAGVADFVVKGGELKKPKPRTKPVLRAKPKPKPKTMLKSKK